MKRVFDVLTAPLVSSLGQVSVRINIPWKAPRDFEISVADGIEGNFEVSARFNSNTFIVDIVALTSMPTRFAAIVTCDTDEPDEQEEVKIEWPPLVEEPIVVRIEG